MQGVIMSKKVQTITPFLWFDHEAEEAARFYVSVFPNSSVGKTAFYTEVGPGPKGTPMTVAFELDGQPFTALNGGPIFKFTEAVSFVVHCETQDEVDRYWERLSEGGEKGQCGWLKDKYGLSWQVVPTVLLDIVQDTNPASVQRVMQVMMKMKKLDVAGLEKAYREE
jgi:predicted 3-demethylubiquinone-9 3-methyltransferase (glyoxalase superfamily)